MNSNRLQEQQLARLHVGQTIDIQRSNGRIHQAVIVQINRQSKNVTVEWQEKNEGKGKEMDLDSIIQLNPDLFGSLVNSPRHFGSQDGLNGQTITNPSRRSRATQPVLVDNDYYRKQGSQPLTSRSNGVTPHHPDTSPYRQQNHHNPSNDGTKSKTVREIERIAANREQRRIKQDERRQKISEVDHSIPAWEFQAMVNEYRQQFPIQPLTLKDPQKDLKICVCVRKRPITKRELNKKDIDVISVPNSEMVIVHLPKVKVDLTKYIDNHKFRFDYGFHESCNNQLVYRFTAQPLVQSLFQGNNPMVFAYGQTGSGSLHRNVQLFFNN